MLKSLRLNLGSLSKHQLNASKLYSTEKLDYEFNPKYVNRNPRNLEMSGHAYKRQGWHLQYPPKDFYNECKLELQGRKLNATVKHFTGKTLLKVSSGDWYMYKHLVSILDTNCVINIARVLADRCRQHGLTNLYFFKGIDYDNSNKIRLFYDTMVENGINMTEPEFIEGKPNIPGLDYDEKDFYHDRLNLPFPPTVNRLKKKLIDESNKQK